MAAVLVLVVGLAVAVLVAAALLGHLDWAGRGIVAAWRRLRPPPPTTDHVSVEILAADLRRLADNLEATRNHDQPAKMARLTAAALAYDWVLLSACRTLDVPVKSTAPMDSLTRLETEAALAAEGLDW